MSAPTTTVAAVPGGDVPGDGVPEGGVPARYEPLLARLAAVRTDCARVARMSIAEGERNGTPYDLDFLKGFVARMERQSAPEPAQRVPVEPRPYTIGDLRRHVEICFKKSKGHWDALVGHDPGHADEVLSLTRQLIGRLAEWGLHAADVHVSTRGPEGKPDPSDHTRAIGALVSGSARLAKSLADHYAGRYPDRTPKRLERDLANMAESKEGARRLLAGGPFQLPAPQMERIGRHNTWWALVRPDGTFSLKQGSVLATRAAEEGVLGPYATKRLATDAGKRATATAEDSLVGLFAHLDAGSLF